MSDGFPIDDPSAAAFDAHAGFTERLTHVGERARAVVESDSEIFHEPCAVTWGGRRSDCGAPPAQLFHARAC